MQAEVNVAKAVINAEAELENDGQQPSDSKVDDDWLLRWRDSAKNVSSEELQALWGRVLAGEIKSPGSFSLRTLEFLKNLSQQDARRIEKLAPFVINRNFVCAEERPHRVLEAEGITFAFLCQLEELGIVSAATPNMMTRIRSSAPDSFVAHLLAYDRALLVMHHDAKKSLNLEIYSVTSLGLQVLRLGAFTPHNTYLRSVGELIKCMGFKVLLARYVQLTENEGRAFDAAEL